MKARWEYKTLEVKPKSMWTMKIDLQEVEKMINQLGGQGWELVSCIPYTATGTTKGILYTFKRQI